MLRSKNSIFSCFESSEPFQKGIKGNVSHKIKNCETVSNPLLYVLLMFVGLCYCLKCHSGAN